ncbi:MAG: hypothetical protein ABUL62_02650 [Myxococcales bacterium]
MAIKFGVAGTHSTGKSTLVADLDVALTRRGLSVGRVGDLAKTARALGFPILREHTFESTLWIMSHGISAQLQVGLKNDVVLVDRPALDAVGYLWAALQYRKEQLSSAHEQYLLALAACDAATYCVLCKTELDPEIPLGPERDKDSAFRVAAGEQIAAVFSRIELSPRTVIVGASFVEELASELEKAVRVA